MKNAAWCLVALGMVAGCGSNARPATDGGVTTPDTGTTPGNDAGSQMADTGGNACPPVMETAPTAAVCAAMTLTCIGNATTQAEQQACFDADPAGQDCFACVQQDVFATCTTQGSCADEDGNFVCCLQSACPDGNQTCLQGALTGACATQANAFQTCLNSELMAQHCGFTQVCFNP